MKVSEDKLHRFLLNCAVLEKETRSIHAEFSPDLASEKSRVEDERLRDFIQQVDLDTRISAAAMARHYEIFFILENQIRDLISDTLEATHGTKWWEKCVPQSVKDEVKKNREREDKEAMSMRSEFEIDYTTFGQLSDIIRANWSDFAGMLSNEPAMTRVLSALNRLRGPIAHCGLLGEDEVDRLKLAIKDWFRVLAGPRRR